MRYKSEYRHSYEEGTVNKSFSISKIAFDMLQENIENQSAFINDLIIDALQEKDFFKRKLLKQVTGIQEDLKKYNVLMEVQMKVKE